MRQLEDLLPLDGKSVLLRADVNVPLADGKITDDFRIRASLETLVWLLRQGASVELCGHLGRPKGKPDPQYSMAPVEACLRELLQQAWDDADGGSNGSDIQQRLKVRENLRFDPGETANDPAFVEQLISNHDCYVNDAFGASHRAHASIVGPPAKLPSAAGRLLSLETDVLLKLRRQPRRPFTAVLGGSKISDKLGVVTALLEVVDQLVIGGAMAFTFLAARGHSVGASLYEPDFVDQCRQLLDSQAEILLPLDFVCETDTGGTAPCGVNVPSGWIGKDIGPGSAADFIDAVTAAGSVFWNGPMGVFEDDRFSAGTQALAEAVSATKAYTVLGGGDTAAAVAGFGLLDGIDHVSTGGGASLELLEQGTLPGIAALE